MEAEGCQRVKGGSEVQVASRIAKEKSTFISDPVHGASPGKGLLYLREVGDEDLGNYSITFQYDVRIWYKVVSFGDQSESSSTIGK